MMWRPAYPSKRSPSRVELIARLAVATSKAGSAWNLIRITVP